MHIYCIVCNFALYLKIFQNFGKLKKNVFFVLFRTILPIAEALCA